LDFFFILLRCTLKSNGKEALRWGSQNSLIIMDSRVPHRKNNQRSIQDLHCQVRNICSAHPVDLMLKMDSEACMFLIFHLFPMDIYLGMGEGLITCLAVYRPLNHKKPQLGLMKRNL
jgi:hypothetical protein